MIPFSQKKLWKKIIITIVVLAIAFTAYWLISKAVFINLANRAYETQDFTKAVKYYNLAAKRGRLNSEILLKQGISNYAIQDFSESEKSYNQILKSTPGDYQALNNLGNIYRDQGEYDKAKEYYLKALAIDPKSAATYNNLSLVYRMQGKTDEEIKLLEDAIGKIENKDDKISFYLALGYLYKNNGQKDKAMEVYNKILELDPENSQAKDALVKL